MAPGAPLVMTQLMAGVRPAWLRTLPFPVPTPPAMRIRNGPSRNRASTLRLTDIVTVQVPVPLQLRSQPLKEWPDLGVAVRVTPAPWLNGALQPVAPTAPLVMVQLIPAGDDLTVPSPVPLPRTVSVLVARAETPSTSVILGVSWQESSRVPPSNLPSRRIGPPANGGTQGWGLV